MQTNEFIEYHNVVTNKQWVFWRNMRKMKDLYQKQYTGYYEPTTTGKEDSFDKWIEKECGIKILFDIHGNVMREYTITDEGKYMLYVLKYL